MFDFFGYRQQLRMKWISHRGLKVAYHQEGRGEDILLIASPFVLAPTYKNTVKELAHHYRVTVIELPGSGRSESLKSPWGFGKHAEFVMEVALKLGLSHACVIGHSNSGPIAALTVRKYPNVFKSAILADSVGAHPSKRIFKIIKGRIVDAILELKLTVTAFPHLLFNLFRHTKSFLSQVAMCRGSLLMHSLERRGSNPILLAWGSRDHTMPTVTADRWDRDWNHTTKYVSPSGSHDWIITHPKEFAKIAQEFLERGDKMLETRTPELLDADPTLLYKYVRDITTTPKPRNYLHPETLDEVAQYILRVWRHYGLHTEIQPFIAQGRHYKNVIASYGPKDAPRIVIGAHYDVDHATPGADDNASGLAALLELARLLQEQRPILNHRIDLVAYCLEEAPFFSTHEMGSVVHARALKEQGVVVKLMMSLEMIGFYSDQEGTQQFPMEGLKHVYPNKGNFIAVVGTVRSFFLTRKLKRLMKKNSRVDVQTLNAPRVMPGIELSDHKSFWDEGYPAVMITDTAFFRNPNYHTAYDTAETLNYTKMAEVVNGVFGVIKGL